MVRMWAGWQQGVRKVLILSSMGRSQLFAVGRRMPSCAEWAGRGQPQEDGLDEEGSGDSGRETTAISVLS